MKVNPDCLIPCGMPETPRCMCADRMVSDGFALWMRCGSRCTLEVVRPGKVQCDGHCQRRSATHEQR